MMNLFPCDASQGMDYSAPKNSFPPRQSSFSSSSSSGTKEEVKEVNETKSVKSELESTPLTIFYGGQVMVFDDFPAENAKEFIELANKGSAKSFPAEVKNNQSAYRNQKEIAYSPIPARSPVKTASQEPIQPNPSTLACGNIP